MKNAWQTPRSSVEVTVLDSHWESIQNLHAQEHLLWNLTRMVILMKCLKPAIFYLIENMSKTSHDSQWFPSLGNPNISCIRLEVLHSQTSLRAYLWNCNLIWLAWTCWRLSQNSVQKVKVIFKICSHLSFFIFPLGYTSTLKNWSCNLLAKGRLLRFTLFSAKDVEHLGRLQNIFI